MGFFLTIIILIVILFIVSKVRKNNKKNEEKEELKDRIHNSQIIKDLKEELNVLIMYHDYDWSHMQMDYYDDCDRCVAVFNDGIAFSIWKDHEWNCKYYIGFVESLGYKPLLDNDLRSGAKYITNEDIYRTFANEVRDILIKLLNDNSINFKYTTYLNGYEHQTQPDGSRKYVKVGDELAQFIYTVPKTVQVKQM